MKWKPSRWRQWDWSRDSFHIQCGHPILEWEVRFEQTSLLGGVQFFIEFRITNESLSEFPVISYLFGALWFIKLPENTINFVSRWWIAVDIVLGPNPDGYNLPGLLKWVEQIAEMLLTTFQLALVVNALNHVQMCNMEPFFLMLCGSGDSFDGRILG